MARGRNRRSTKCTNSSPSSRPGRDPIFNGSESSSVPPSPSYHASELPRMRFPYEMSETGSEPGGKRYRGKPLYSVYGEDYSEDGSDDDDDDDERTEMSWDRNDPGCGLGPQDQFREDRPKTPPPSPSLSEREDDYRAYQDPTRYRTRRSYGDPSQGWYEPSPSRFKDKLAYDTYGGKYGVSSPESDCTRSDCYPEPEEKWYEYVDPARQRFVRSRPLKPSTRTSTRTDKKGLLDGKSQVEATLCSVM